jgi:ABC-type phosphate/phosphonate transport system substrate-binding protein
MGHQGKTVGHGKSWAATAAMGALLLSACGSKEERAPAPKPTEASRPTQAKSPVDFSADPQEKKRQQAEIMDHMMEDLKVPTDTVIGEAARRGVEIDPARIERRRAAEKTQAAH